jgi:hypothetical protein
LILLDDTGGIRVPAQLDLVVGATDPGPDRLIRRTADEIIVEGDGYLRRRRGVHTGDGLPARWPVTRPAVINRNAPAAAGVRRFRGAKRGANVGRHQATSGDNQPWFV